MIQPSQILHLPHRHYLRPLLHRYNLAHPLYLADAVNDLSNEAGGAAGNDFGKVVEGEDVADVVAHKLLVV